MNIFSLFETAAQGIEKVPWRWRALAGMTAGAGYQVMAGDEDTDIMDRITKGLLIGGLAGAGAPGITRGLGRVARFGGGIAEGGIRNKIEGVQAGIKKFGPWSPKSYKTLMTPGFLGLAGAGIGAAIAPEGHRMQGAMIGGGIGFISPAIRNLWRGYSTLEKIPGAQTGALIAAASIPLAASAVFGRTKPEAVGFAIPGVGAQMDYEPLEGDMKNRMTAMNASGDIVLGLHNRKHGA
jgi:hypothetical protein